MGWRKELDAQRLRADTAEADLKQLLHTSVKEEVFDAVCKDRDQLKGIASAYIASDGEKDLRLAAAEQRIADALQLLAETSKAILHHQANQPMSHRLEGLLTKARAKVDRYLKSAALNPNPEAESHE
jgi:hypothetical protein